MDCGEPDTPSNGGVSDAITTEGSTVVYSCDSGFVLCGDENRTCLSTGMWSGSVPDCISEFSIVILCTFLHMSAYSYASEKAMFSAKSNFASDFWFGMVCLHSNVINQLSNL